MTKFPRAQSGIFHESVLGGSIAELPDAALSFNTAAAVPLPAMTSSPPSQQAGSSGAGRRVPQEDAIGAATSVLKLDQPPYRQPLTPHNDDDRAAELMSIERNGGGVPSPGVSAVDPMPFRSFYANRIGQSPAGFGAGAAGGVASPTTRGGSSGGVVPSPAMQRAVHLVQADFQTWQRLQGPQVDETMSSLNASLTQSPGRVTGGGHRCVNSGCAPTTTTSVVYPAPARRDDTSPLCQLLGGASPLMPRLLPTTFSTDDATTGVGTPTMLLRQNMSVDHRTTSSHQAEFLTQMLAINQRDADRYATAIARLDVFKDELLSVQGMIRDLVLSRKGGGSGGEGGRHVPCDGSSPQEQVVVMASEGDHSTRTTTTGLPPSSSSQPLVGVDSAATSSGSTPPLQQQRCTSGDHPQPPPVIRLPTTTLSSIRHPSSIITSSCQPPPPRPRTILLLLFVVATSVVGNVILHAQRRGGNVVPPLFLNIVKIFVSIAQYLLHAAGRRHVLR